MQTINSNVHSLSAWLWWLWADCGCLHVKGADEVSGAYVRHWLVWGVLVCDDCDRGRSLKDGTQRDDDAG